MTSWYDRSRAVILEMHKTFPSNMTFEERKKALRAAYPFGQRQYWPYKMWCKAQREYLSKFGGKKKTAPPMTEGLFAVQASLFSEAAE